MTVDAEFLRGMTEEELCGWAERELGVYLSVNAAKSALLGQLSRLGTVL